MIKIAYAASWLAGRRFYSFSHTLYKDDHRWQEPVVWRGRKVLSARYNPLMGHPHALLMAVEGRRVFARALVGAVGERGYFSMFDAENHEEATARLMDEAAAWMRRNGVSVCVGPTPPQLLDLGGSVLVEGFDEPPAFCDTYNASYYDALLTGCGLKQHEDFLTYRVGREFFNDQKYAKVAGWAADRFGYEVRENLAEQPEKLTDMICAVMGDAADRNGMSFLINAVYPYFEKEMCPAVYAGGEPAGYLLTLKGRAGRARVVTMWVHEKWRRKGVTALLFLSVMRGMDRLRMTEIDASWVSVTNEASVRSVENAGGRKIHRYRQYLLHI